eukprot:365733-Chlamydomonas_euryale.AAC.32
MEGAAGTFVRARAPPATPPRAPTLHPRTVRAAVFERGRACAWKLPPILRACLGRVAERGWEERPQSSGKLVGAPLKLGAPPRRGTDRVLERSESTLSTFPEVAALSKSRHRRRRSSVVARRDSVASAEPAALLAEGMRLSIAIARAKFQSSPLLLCTGVPHGSRWCGTVSNSAVRHVWRD